MPILPSFSTPAKWLDFSASDPNQALLNAAWSANINRWTQVAILGNPWSSRYDSPRSYYFNPLVTDVPSDTKSALITWSAFPGRLSAYFGGTFPGFPPSGTPSSLLLAEWADTGVIPQMPTSVCPPTDMTPTAYTPTGPRGWQDEYCEWSVTRNAAGKITKVMFTCENPEYWFTLWSISPEKVLSLYQSLVSPKVTLNDLSLLSNGVPVIDPTTGRPAYNPLNKWNNGTVGTPDYGGAVHLTSSPNTLGAEIYLAAAASILRQDRSGNPITSAADLICCTHYGRPLRNSDPHIGYTVNFVVNKTPALQATLSDPVGLYIQDPDFSGFALPANAPSGAKVTDYWKVVRGTAGGQTLHAVFEVPEDQGFTVSDITINSVPIQYGSQIVATFRIGLSAMAIQAPVTPNPPQVCPITLTTPTPNVGALQPMAVYTAARAVETSNNELPFSLPILALQIQPGQTLKNVAMYCSAADATTKATCPEGGVTFQITSQVAIDTDGDYLMTVDITADANAATGDRTVQLQRGTDKISGMPAPGLLTVAPGSSTATYLASSASPVMRSNPLRSRVR